MSMIQQLAEENAFRIGFQNGSSLVVFNFPVNETSQEHNSSQHAFRSNEWLLKQEPNSTEGFPLMLYELDSNQTVQRGSLSDPTALQSLIQNIVQSKKKRKIESEDVLMQ